MQSALIFVYERVQWTVVVSFAGIDVLVSQCSRRDVKRNLKACSNVTCSEIVHLNVMSHVHVRVLRVAKPLYYCFRLWLVACSRHLGLYSLSGKPSYRQISWSLEVAGLYVAMMVSFRNSTSNSAALLPRCQSIFWTIENSYPESRGFETLRDLAVRCPPA